MGAVYPDVPAVTLPIDGGGTAKFTDVSDTTASASDVAQGKYFYTSSGVYTQGTASGGGAAVVVTETADTGGGTVKEITAVDISSDTVDAAHLLQGYTAHDHNGNAVTGTYTPSSTQTQTKTATPTESQQTITPDTGYLLSSVTVNAISSTYVGSGIDRRSSSDLTASGATVTVPAGYYSAQASKAVTSGSAGTPTATKGTVSNHSVSVTPSVTNTTGYITGSTKTGTAVTVSASELVSGNLAITQNGNNIDVANYSTVSVNVSGGGVNVKQTTWTNSSTSTVSHQFTGLSGTPKFAVLRCTSQLTRSSSNTYYYIADIVWNGTNAYGNYHLRSNGSFNNVASDANPGFSVTVGTNSITFSSGASSRSSAPGSFYNGTYELTYVY